GVSPARLEAIRRRMKEGQLNVLRELLPDRVIHEACAQMGHAYRERLLPPIVMVFHYLYAALWPEDSFQAAAAAGGLAVGSGSLSKARQRLPRGVIEHLGRYTSALGQSLSEGLAQMHGFRLVSLDGTCVSMEDVPELWKEFGTADTRHGPGKYPEARLVVASLVKTGVVLDHRLGSYRTSEHALGLDLLISLRPGDLLLADAHFAGSNLYFRYLEHGVQFITPVHQRLKVERLRRTRQDPDGSFVAEVPIWPSHRKKYPFLPRTMLLRFVPVRLRSRVGRPLSYLVTSLLDAERYGGEVIRDLYRMRWPIEPEFNELKHPLSADVLRSKTVDSIYKEVTAKVMAMNLLRCLMLQAAQRYGREPDRLSFAHTRRSAVAYSLRMSAAPISRLLDLYDELLAEIARVWVVRRPGRIEPRALRRETKHYDRLKTTRREWRLRHGLVA
ncbi:MAG: IS4 family transposase, partial [Planctomycetota bacterium]